MIIGVAKESFPGERRVALVPAAVPALVKAGHELRVEAGAGQAAGFPDAHYQDKGARLCPQRSEVFEADVLLAVRAAGANPQRGPSDLEFFRNGQALIGYLEPLGEPAALRGLAQRGVSALAMELVPRITRAQSMDALSSMATIAGYKAALLAAEQLPRMFPMMFTAAGTVTAAKVLVIGAGVAGLQAIATARRLGAVVSGYDLRPVVREQVESLGARFVDLGVKAEDAEDRGGYAKAQSEAFYRRQQEAMARVVAEHDVLITTALVPGKRAPLLVTRAMVAGMRPGSVIVDLAAERGGNCEGTRLDEVVLQDGVTILGPGNLPSTVPYHASQMYCRNVTTLLAGLVKEGALALDLEDEVLAGCLVTHEGRVVHPRVAELLGSEVETAAPAERA